VLVDVVKNDVFATLLCLFLQHTVAWLCELLVVAFFV